MDAVRPYPLVHHPDFFAIVFLTISFFMDFFSS
jgi:hypothetical protein